MIKTAQELKYQAARLGIDYYPVHECSMCGYMCGYIIDGDSVAYDSGCGCVAGANLQPRDWEDLARTYNMNQPENNPEISEEFLSRLNNTWRFELAGGLNLDGGTK